MCIACRPHQRLQPVCSLGKSPPTKMHSTPISKLPFLVFCQLVPISSYFYVFVPAISYPNSPSLHDTCAKKRWDHRAFTGGGEGEGLVDPSTHRAPPLGVTGVGRCAWPESSEQNPVEALVGHGRDTTEITRPQPPSIIMPESLSSSFQEQGQLT